MAGRAGGELMSYKSSPRGSRPVRLLVLHTTQGAMTPASLGAYSYRPDIKASSHVGIDGKTTLQFVSYARSAWTVRSGNAISDNAELCGYAHWTRAQWLNEHKATLDRAAAWLRARTKARGIPLRKLTPSDVAAGKSGVIGHWDWTLGAHDGTHTEPGSGVAWDYVITRAAARGASPEEDDDMPTAAEIGGYKTPSTEPDMHAQVVEIRNDLNQLTTWLAGRLDSARGDDLAEDRGQTTKLNAP